MYGNHSFNLMNLSLKECIDLYRATDELQVVGLKRPILERIGFLTFAAGSAVLDVLALCEQYRIDSLSRMVVVGGGYFMLNFV